MATFWALGVIIVNFSWDARAFFHWKSSDLRVENGVRRRAPKSRIQSNPEMLLRDCLQPDVEDADIPNDVSDCPPLPDLCCTFTTSCFAIRLIRGRRAFYSLIDTVLASLASPTEGRFVLVCDAKRGRLSLPQFEMITILESNFELTGLPGRGTPAGEAFTGRWSCHGG